MVRLPTGLQATPASRNEMGGIEVGGILARIHRLLTTNNALQLTIENGNSQTIVSIYPGMMVKNTLWN